MVINHLENIKGICTKTGLVKSLRRFYKSAPGSVAANYNVYDSTPTTFLVLPECNDPEYQAFEKRFHELEKKVYRKERLPAKHCESNMWLIKPAAENQGRGIEVFKDNLGDMKKFLCSKPPNTYWVVQKYLERPLLYCTRKFDIRMWALITWKDEFYYYKHGYLRTSSDAYTLDSKLNYVHLTNNCLQKYGENYGNFEVGNTIGFEVFEKYVNEQFPQRGFNFEQHIIPRIKDLMIDSFLSVKGELNPSNRRNCFELLGFDFMIDEDFRVWLIEINTNPYLGVPNKFIEGLLPKMLNDMLSLTLDPCVKPANPAPPTGILLFLDKRIEVDNQFELLYDDRRKVSQRRGYSEPVYAFPDLVPPSVSAPISEPVSILPVSPGLRTCRNLARRSGGR